MQLYKRALLVLVSGASFWPISYIAGPLARDIVSFVLVGGIFGLCVLVPFITSPLRRMERVLGLLVGSILIYIVAVKLAVKGYGPLQLGGNAGIVTSGVLGAMLVGVLTKFIVPLRTTKRFFMYVPVAGLIGGVLFSMLWNSKYEAVTAIAYIAWQLPVFLALYFGTAGHRTLMR